MLKVREFLYFVSHKSFNHAFNLCEFLLFMFILCGQVVQALVYCVHLWLKFFLG
jgi:hypothetical protein